MTAMQASQHRCDRCRGSDLEQVGAVLDDELGEIAAVLECNQCGQTTTV